MHGGISHEKIAFETGRYMLGYLIYDIGLQRFELELNGLAYFLGNMLSLDIRWFFLSDLTF